MQKILILFLGLTSFAYSSEKTLLTCGTIGTMNERQFDCVSKNGTEYLDAVIIDKNGTYGWKIRFQSANYIWVKSKHIHKSNSEAKKYCEEQILENELGGLKGFTASLPTKLELDRIYNNARNFQEMFPSVRSVLSLDRAIENNKVSSTICKLAYDGFYSPQILSAHWQNNRYGYFIRSTFSGNSKYYATLSKRSYWSSNDTLEVEVIETSTKKILNSFELEYLNYVYDFQISNDGKYVSISGDPYHYEKQENHPRIFDALSGAEISKFPEMQSSTRTTKAVWGSFSPTFDKYVAYNSYSDLPDNQRITVYDFSSRKPLSSLAKSPDTVDFLSNGYLVEYYEDAIVIEGSEINISDLNEFKRQVSTDGTHLLLTSNSSVKVLEIKTMKAVFSREFKLPNYSHPISYSYLSRDGKKIVIVRPDGSISPATINSVAELYDIPSGKKIAKLKLMGQSAWPHSRQSLDPINLTQETYNLGFLDFKNGVFFRD